MLLRDNLLLIRLVESWEKGIEMLRMRERRPKWELDKRVCWVTNGVGF